MANFNIILQTKADIYGNLSVVDRKTFRTDSDLGGVNQVVISIITDDGFITNCERICLYVDECITTKQMDDIVRKAMPNLNWESVCNVCAAAYREYTTLQRAA